MIDLSLLTGPEFKDSFAPYIVARYSHLFCESIVATDVASLHILEKHWRGDCRQERLRELELLVHAGLGLLQFRFQLRDAPLQGRI